MSMFPNTVALDPNHITDSAAIPSKLICLCRVGLAERSRSFPGEFITETFMRRNFVMAAALLFSLAPALAQPQPQSQPPVSQPQEQPQTQSGGAGAFGPAKASPELRQARRAVRQACMDDIRALCAGSEPGGGKVLMCLRSHKDQVSDGCKAATAHLREVRRRA